MTEQDSKMHKEMELLNGAALAYVGDAVYEVAVRQHVIHEGKTQANQLHQAAIHYVSAIKQAQVMRAWLKEEGLLSQKEIQIYKRGRNHKANTKAKNASIGDYRQATGFEALIGWLHLTQQDQRAAELIQRAINDLDREEE